MFSSKEKVFMFLRQYSNTFAGDEIPAVSTQFLSEQLHMQRTNISSLLNDLVEEGRVLKLGGRPVLYRLKELVAQEPDKTFSNVIGFDGSLREMLDNIKAILLWPHDHYMLFISPQGCGMRYIADEIYKFAITHKLLYKTARYQVFDCFTYVDKQEELRHALFGVTGVIQSVDKGMLLIKNIDLLSGFDRSLCFAILQGNRDFYEKHIQLPEDYRVLMLAYMKEDSDSLIQEVFIQQFKGAIHIPSLAQRPLAERFACIQKFVQTEAVSIQKTFVIDMQVLQDLLLYPCLHNLKGLQGDIHQGCANAYARLQQSKQNNILLQLSDFPNYIRKGMLYYKYVKSEMERMFPSPCIFLCNEKRVIKKIDNKNKPDAYHTLSRKGIQHIQEDLGKEVQTVIIKNDFYRYFDAVSKRVSSKEQLEKLVSKKLITLISQFLKEAGLVLHRTYSNNTLFGLCLHINMILVNVAKHQYVDNVIIKDIIEEYEQEYVLTKSFVEVIKKEFGTQLSVDEVSFLMFVLCKEARDEQEDAEIVTLVVLHGSQSASSIAYVVNQMIPENTIFAYDIPLDKSVDDAYEELKQKLLAIHQGKGIFVIYDMGSIKTMCESIAYETKLAIRYFEIPITLVGIACAKETKKSNNLDEVYTILQHHYHDYLYKKETSIKDILLLLERTDENEIQDLPTYIKEHFDTNWECYSLKMDDRNNLFNEISTLRKHCHIHGIIGTYDPQLAHLPFCSLDKLYAEFGRSLEQVFKKTAIQSQEQELFEAMEYLQAQFEICDMSQVSPMLMQFLEALEKELQEELNLDQKIGIVVHVACLIERLLKNQTPPVNFEAAAIFRTYPDLIGIVRTLLNPMEKSLHILINDSEAATIVSIIKQR